MANDLARRQKPGAIVDYDPKRGLDMIAVAKAAEERYAKAKDLDRLSEAVELKLGEQRNFVLWWDGSGFNEPTPPVVSGLKRQKAGKDGIPDRITIHRWRTRLKDEDKFLASLEAALERCRRVCEAEKGSTEQRGASGTGKNEWFTPVKVLDVARGVLGAFDLDPASSDIAQETVQAEIYFTPEEDGLAQDWFGRVWLNPPYAQPDIGHFVSKLVAEWRAGRIEAAIMVTHNYTDTAWFHEAAGAASAICFTRGRIGFVDAQSVIAAPTQGQAFHYFGADVAGFAVGFREVGFVVVPWKVGP